MIKVCLADNYPVVHFGVKSYFRDHASISIVSNVGNFSMVKDVLYTKEIDVLLIDLDLDGLSSLYELKAIIKNYTKTKIIVFSSYSEQIYAPNAIKAGVAGYVHKTAKLETLGIAITKVHQGQIILNDAIKKNLALIAKQNKSERLYRKLSNREIEVLLYLSNGKKNNEIFYKKRNSDKRIS